MGVFTVVKVVVKKILSSFSYYEQFSRLHIGSTSVLTPDNCFSHSPCPSCDSSRTPALPCLTRSGGDMCISCNMLGRYLACYNTFLLARSLCHHRARLTVSVSEVRLTVSHVINRTNSNARVLQCTVGRGLQGTRHYG